MLKAVIFDLDGVIIDSEPFHREVNDRLFFSLGISVSDEEYSDFIGLSNARMWSVLKEQQALPQTVPMLVRMQVSENINYLETHLLEPRPGLLELLHGLKSNGLALGLASSSPREYISLVLDKLRIGSYFTAVVSGEEIDYGKPHPDIFLKTSSLLKTQPPDCAVIEDARHGVAAAKAAGMLCLAFKCPSSGNQDVSAADFIASNLEEMLYQIIKLLPIN